MNQNFCANCYTKLENPASRLKCGKCKKRTYCSRQCQLEDWSSKHSFWCGKAGEIGYDYEIKPSDKFNGFGVFALRDFNKSEKIMAEKGFSSDNIMSTTQSQREAILQLEPSTSDLIADKFDLNSLDCGKNINPVLCLHASRINHQCPFVENCSHYWIKEHGIKIIYAKQNIKSGEEITISYIDSFNSYSELNDKWGFQCVCEGCSNPYNMVYQKEIVKLNQFIINQKISSDIRVKACDKLIELYLSKDIPIMMYMRTYWDKYNLCWENEDFESAKESLEKCIQMEFDIMGFESDNLKMLKQRLLLFGSKD